MKTAERTSEHWVVDVEDVRDIEKGWAGYVKRFTFQGEDAALLAWSCVQRAEAAGFKATSGKVKRT